MKEINVTGQKRTDLGKKASKTLRKEGLIPCNLYGEKKGENGAPEALSFAVPFAELRKIIYTPHVYVINLIIDGESHTAIMKEIQFHPTTDAPLHPAAEITPTPPSLATAEAKPLRDTPTPIPPCMIGSLISYLPIKNDFISVTPLKFDTCRLQFA